MSDNPLSTPVEYMKGVGPRRAKALTSVGIATLQDLLDFRPHRFLDRSAARYIRDIILDEEVTVMGKIVAKKIIRYGKRRLIVRLEDGTGSLEAVWFHQVDLFDRIFNENQVVAFSGKVTRYKKLQMMHPSFDILSETSEALNTGQLIPVYPSNQELKKVGLNNYSFRKIISIAMHRYRQSIPETLPISLIKKYYLLPRSDAYFQMHFPESPEMIHQVYRRFKYEELFYLQLLMALRKHFYSSPLSGISMKMDAVQYSKMLTRLPFALTKAQSRTVKEIQQDMASGHPMNRLVQGDVGSGKTIVALLAIHLAVSNGYQTALMAPTEILAQQHYWNINGLLTNLGISCVLLIGTTSAKEKAVLYSRISDGQVDLVIGTHALIQEQVDFGNLGLAVIDEQHRFGVLQRAELVQKGKSPHILVMTATPIPRTLALTIYGDLDVSVIDELPPGRRGIKTYWRNTNRMEKIYDFVRDQVKQGSQVYVVYPLVEESQKLELKAATEAFQKLQQEVFPNLKLALLHGRLKMAEKEKIMKEFNKGNIHILISTTVIEVGVDVHNATVMIVEHAERFGLSQLHQLRGRVGRGRRQSYCILVTPPEINEVSQQRIEVMVKTNDGFVIAEEDLKIRGAGEFFGTRQHGIPDLKYANLVTDQKIVFIARQDAFAIVDKDPHLRQPYHDDLRNHFKSKFYDKFHLPNIA